MISTPVRRETSTANKPISKTSSTNKYRSIRGTSSRHPENEQEQGKRSYTPLKYMHHCELGFLQSAPMATLLYILVEMHVRHTHVFKNICYKAKILYVLKS
jgi:hypothetical protein